MNGNVIYDILLVMVKVGLRSVDLMVIRNFYVILGLVVIGIFVLIVVVKMLENSELDIGESIG